MFHILDSYMWLGDILRRVQQNISIITEILFDSIHLSALKEIFVCLCVNNF